MDELQKHAKWKKPDPKTHVWFYLYEMFSKGDQKRAEVD